MLTDLDKAILDLEAEIATMVSPKRAHVVRSRSIRERLGLRPSEYFLRLSELIDRPEAYDHNPALVARLRRLRAEKLAERNQDHANDRA